MNLWRIEGDNARLSLHHGQAQAWRSDRRFVFILAGTQSGKTAFGPWWLYREINRCGAGDYLAVTASYDLFKLKMLPELRTIYENVLRIGRYWSGERIIELRDPTTNAFRAQRADDPMWGRVILRSAAAEGGLEAATGNAAWLDECGQDKFTVEDYEAVQRRLSLARGRILGTTTLYNIGWLKSEVYNPWVEGDPDIEVVQFPSYINPAFPRSEYDRMQERLPDWRFAMFYDGQFARPAGLIYGAFEGSMLVDPFSIPLHWRRWVGVDFGGANTAIVWAAEDPDTGIWYIYSEWLGGGLTSAEYAARAREGLLGAYDWSATGGSGSEEQSRRDWTVAGFAIQAPTHQSIEAGITNVIGFIKTSRFRVFRTCKGVRDEIGSYRRKLDTAGEPTEEIVAKRTFHRLDAIRYMFSGIDAPAPRSVRSMRG